MHELAVCEGLRKVLEEQAQARNFTRVIQVWLEIGELAGLEVDAIRFSFNVAMKGSLAEDAALKIVEVPARAWCPTCMQEVAIKQRFDGCPHCGGLSLQVVSGEEMRIKEVEVN